MSKLSLRLTVDVDYDGDVHEIHELEDQLHFIVENASLNGMLSGPANAEVEHVDSRVSIRTSLPSRHGLTGIRPTRSLGVREPGTAEVRLLSSSTL